MKWICWIVVILICGALFDAGTVGAVVAWIVLAIAAALQGVVAFGGRLEGTEEQAALDSPVKASRMKSSPATHVVARPRGTTTEPWAVDVVQHEVAGENYQEENVAKLFRGVSIRGDNGAELTFDAQLVPDPSNPFDANAVAVYVQDNHVGYLERDVAARYFSSIAREMSAGNLVTVRSRQWARGRGDRVYARVTLMLPQPDGFGRPEGLPDDALVLPAGGAIQVTKEENHMDVLTPLLPTSGTRWLAATLHLVDEVRARSIAQVVEVRIGGCRVGVLTSTQTTNLSPLVKFAAEQDRTAVGRAALHGNSLKAEVTLHVAKAQDVDSSWLASMRAAT